jgi:hypothetical protein
MMCETLFWGRSRPQDLELSSREPAGQGHLQLPHCVARGGESDSNLEKYIFANRSAAAPPHEADGLCP